MNISGMPADVFIQQDKLGDIKSRGDTPQALKEAAEAFESVFLNELLNSMREANKALGEENLLGGKEEGFYRSMMDSQLAQQLGQSGGIGLAEAMVRQLNKGNEL